MLPDTRRRLRCARPFAPRNDDLIRCDFDLYFNGPHGTYRNEDQGVSKQVLIESDYSLVRPYRRINTAGIGSGPECDWNGWIGLAGSGAYMAIPYDASNAITSGDCFVGCWVFWPTSPGGLNTYYMLSVQDATPTAAGTAWAIVSGGGSVAGIGIVYSDGSSRSFAPSGTTDFPSPGWYYVAFERVSGTVYMSVNGSVKGSFSFSSAFNVPSSAVIRLATPLYAGAQKMPDESLFANLQVKPRSVFGGADFIPPKLMV